MSCCNNDYMSKNESIMIVNKARDAASCAEANCASSFTNATNAASSATAAQAALTSFQSIYLGAQSSAPTTTQVGALYFNTGSNQMFVWNGTTWAAL